MEEENNHVYCLESDMLTKCSSTNSGLPMVGGAWRIELLRIFVHHLGLAVLCRKGYCVDHCLQLAHEYHTCPDQYHTSVLVSSSELWVVLDALRHAWRLGIQRMKVETDNVKGSRILNHSSSVISDDAIVLSTEAMLALDWDIVTRHSPKTANGVTYALAKLS
ncbi:hypothetical protein V6N12_035680 [Hibiscus sabdariffa]|uniref:RNase H type-1 domain-containing protein n=1 Tax=Hibiscus sabdariffa TaxID=183260 RepID=A0ABR2ENF9_9ROSI